ncbi:fibrobacter succinogenes major paralogous domain-containing protein [Hallerella succinigenes]|uniref:Uncharacterized protein (TIGR02145 family) n=1 Tax=Hallerella succinigenes TaxID=1896222 RepID=A0A2M9A5F8_9BACT|nr:fibrobacter succinogenes major paralogous domain-containing protein [Hallerella succinigenes]MDD6092396.1 fibrobacter succinogenes major paralogous domain-containing protein [Hallerella succinigenes]PJJ40952.1 uncharacterized protein (TIGR02145 family) [Hallerella succinigenes]
MKQAIFTILLIFPLVGLASCEKDSFTDSRDGQTYRTVQIGNQTWMAENLNYHTEGSSCYGDKPANCQKYGRHYTWEAALNACPSGWHLPSMAEFDTLIATVGGVDVAGKVLKSKSGWKSDGNGTDAYGFSALPAGVHFSDDDFGDAGSFGDAGDYANFWSTTEDSRLTADLMSLKYGDDRAYLYDGIQLGRISVRCLRDSRL